MFKTTRLLNFTTLYRSGNPFKTDAVIVNINGNSFSETDEIKYLIYIKKESELVFRYNLKGNDRIFGLGESLGGLNKRGKRYVLYNIDDHLHTPEKESLYSSHPFLMVDGEESFGLFIDFPSEIIFDLGFTDKDIMEITLPSNNFNLYVFDNADKKKIIKEFLLLTGRPYVPPKWAFGYHQSRWSYPDAKTIKKVANNFRSRDIPCDAIYMDIDYMERFKVFTIDPVKFPDFESFIQDLKKEGFKLIPIIDPGVKIEKGFNVYEEGIEKGYFCKDSIGNYFAGAVWPGLSHFPDFSKADVRIWWGGLHKKFIEIGIEGFWNDMNEPSIFFTQKSLNEIHKLTGNLKEVGKFDHKELRKRVLNLSNRRDYFKNFYHEIYDGKFICHDDIHNLYGYNMTRSTVDGFKEYMSGKRYFLLSRSSYTGLHRFAAIWMGDNMSWWEHMIVHIRMLVSLNMAGFFFTGADVGGFGGNVSPELLIRWMQLGAFSPLFRNHSAIGTRDQEPWAFDEWSLKIMRDIIKLRYAFLPYTYSEFMRSTKELSPFVSPLMLHFDTEIVKDIEDQFMYGNSIMVAPIYNSNGKGRFVHLPETMWLYWNLSKYYKKDIQVMKPGDYYVNANLDQIPIFIRDNSLIVFSKPMNFVGEKDIVRLVVVGLVTDKAEFIYYEDDGKSFDYEKGLFSTLKIKVLRDRDSYKISYNLNENRDIPIKIKNIKFEIYDVSGELYENEISLKR